MQSVPCIVADDLNEQQVKALRVADNKVGESSQWDFDLLDDELKSILDIDMSDFGFNDDFDRDEPEAIDLDDYDNVQSDKKKTCCCPKCGFEFEI